MKKKVKAGKRIYIAYGSNLNTQQMVYRCPTARRIGSGMLKGWRLAFKGLRTGSFLTILRDPDGEVPVGLFEVQEWDEEALDRYEGYPVLYQKIEQSVQTEKGQVKGFVYVMREDAEYGIPTGLYVKICLEGYEDFGFEDRYFWDALKESKEKSDER